MPTQRPGPPLIDFGALAQIPQAYYQGQERRQQEAFKEALRGGLPRGPGGEIDYGALASLAAQFGQTPVIETMSRLQQSAASQRRSEAALAETMRHNRVLEGRPQIVGHPDTGYFAIDRNGSPMPTPSSPTVIGDAEGQKLGIYPTPGARPAAPSAPGMRPVIPPRAGTAPKPPADFQWKDPTNTALGVEPIPGSKAERVDAEVAARIGLGLSWLGQLEDFTDAEGKPQKGLRARLREGATSGIVNAASAWASIGGPGEARRLQDSGADALLRNLTGAGMSESEARDYVRRYRFVPGDSADTSLSKINQLERELRFVMETVGRGRGGVPQIGGVSNAPPPAQPGQSAPPLTDIPPRAIAILKSRPETIEDFKKTFGVNDDDVKKLLGGK